MLVPMQHARHAYRDSDSGINVSDARASNSPAFEYARLLIGSATASHIREGNALMRGTLQVQAIRSKALFCSVV